MRPRVMMRRGLYGPIPDGGKVLAHPLRCGNPLEIGREGKCDDVVGKHRR